MGSSGGGSTTSKVRYAEYIENHHAGLLSIMAAERDKALLNNPFTDYVDVDIDVGFFGVGYALSSYPALYDMYGKFMAGLDVDYLFDQIATESLDGAHINNLVAAESALMDDDIQINSLPRFKAGMRDINSVMSSAYVIGKALIEDGKTKALSKFSSELRYKMIPVAAERWSRHLDWNKAVVGAYADIMKLYFSAKLDVNDANYSFKAKEVLWPFTVLDYDRAVTGALQGAVTRSEDVAGASKASRAMAGALSGAALGASVGLGVPGAIVGGLIGLAAGLFG